MTNALSKKWATNLPLYAIRVTRNHYFHCKLKALKMNVVLMLFQY